MLMVTPDEKNIVEKESLVMKSPSKRNGHDNVEIDLSRKGAALFLSKKVERAIKEGVSTIKLRARAGSTDCYPNVCVPLAGVIDYYRSAFGIEFVPAQSWKNAKMLACSGTIVPYEFDEVCPPNSFLNKVWKFSPGTHFEIVSGIVESLRRSGVMGKGVLLGFELALNEVTDNILQHSISEEDKSEPIGFVMVQHHKNTGRIVAAVFDAGQGIIASLREGGMPIHSEEEGLQKAMMRGVTSGNGAGNGLWMMERIVLASSGSFDLVSDGARHSLRNSVPSRPRSTSANAGKFKEGTTLVDFQISCKDDILLEEALESQATDLWLENHYASNDQDVIVLVKDEARGCGSRLEGKYFSNVVLNLCKATSGKCILDFTDISIVSASFADQLISDFVDALTFLGFMSRIVFKGLSPACIIVINECFKTRFYNDDLLV